MVGPILGTSPRTGMTDGERLQARGAAEKDATLIFA